MARQRIRVQGRDALLVAVVAVGSGVLAAIAGPSPTGSATIDAVLVVVAGAAAVWAAASAAWWTGVAAAAVAAAFAPEWYLLVLAAMATLGGLWIGLQRRSLPWSRALVAGVALQVLARLGDIERFGVTSLLGVGVMLFLAVMGIVRRPRRERRVMWWVLGGLAGGTLLATAGFGVAALQAQADLEEGNTVARRAIDLLGSGELVQAQVEFVRAAEVFGDAGDALGRVWGQPARLVPVLAQHRDSAVELTRSGAEVSQTIANVLSVVDYDDLRVVNGRIDVDSVAILQQPLSELDAAIGELERTVRETRSPWLVDALGSRLDDLLADVAEQRVTADNAMTAVQQAPAMLGADGPRRYFVAFTTPVEARGLGGFMGNWAEITITDGKLTVTDFGRTKELNDGGDAAGKTLTGISDEYVARYGDFLLLDPDSPDRVVGPGVWSNITGSPDFPSVAATMAELYPKSGGREVDGVFVLDVYAIAKLMEITGPVDVPDAGVTIDPADAASFLLTEQYELADSAARVDVLETVALTTVQRLLSTTLPSPPELGRMFGQLAREGRLAGWAVRPEEQEVFDRVNMAGRLAPRDGGDGLLVTLNNAGANKVDAFVDGSVEYQVAVDRENDRVSGVITITLRNSSPTSGLPDGVIGNYVDLPPGTNRTFLTIYTGLPVLAYSIDDVPVGMETGTELGYVTSSTYVDIDPGQERRVVLFVEGSIPDDVAYRLALSNQPLTRTLPATVTVDGVSWTPEPVTRAGVTYLP